MVIYCALQKGHSIASLGRRAHHPTHDDDIVDSRNDQIGLIQMDVMATLLGKNLLADRREFPEIILQRHPYFFTRYGIFPICPASTSATDDDKWYLGNGFVLSHQHGTVIKR